MIKLLIIPIFTVLSLAAAQDEFFQPGYSIGGYGELHWNQVFDDIGDGWSSPVRFQSPVKISGEVRVRAQKIQ